MRKGRIIKGLAMAIIAVMVLGCLSLNNTSAATVNHSSHIDIRTNAAITLSDDGSLDGVTISKDNISYVGYKVGNAENFKEGIWEDVADGREKYEVKYNAIPTFDVYDPTLQILIKGTYSNGNPIGKEGEGIIIDQTSTYPDNTYIEYINTSGKNTIYAMKHFGIEKVTIDGNDYYDVSNKSIISVAIAMCNGVKAERTGDYAITVCGTDFYLNPQIVKIIEDQDELTVKKNWTNVEGNLIPSNVTVQLYKDGEAVESKIVTLNADNNWTSVIKYTKEEGAKYIVKEIAIDGVAVEDSGFTAKEKEVISYGAITFEDKLVSLDTVEPNGSPYKTFESGVWTKHTDKIGQIYFVAAEDGAFGISKLEDKGLFVVWTYNELNDADKQAFIDGVNAKGDLVAAGYTNDVLTIDNCKFISGVNAIYEYTVGELTTSEPVAGSYTFAPYYTGYYPFYQYHNYFTSESAATADMNEYKDEIEYDFTKDNDSKNKVEVTFGDCNVYVVSGSLSESTTSPKTETNNNKKYSSYEEAEKAMNNKIKTLTKNNSATKYVTVDENSKSVNKNGNKYTFSFKYTTTTVSDTRKWGYVINYTTTTTTDTRENRNLTFHKSTKQERKDYKKLGENDIVFNYSNRSDWTYLYDGRFTSQSTPDEDLWTVTNEYENKTVITGSKTFEMQNQNDIAVPVKDNGEPNISLEVYKNGLLLDDNYSVVWSKVDGTNNQWTFTITGDAITKYYDSDSSGKLDAVATYEVKEAGVNDNNQITIGNFEYTVTYADGNAITNTLDTSSFTGDLTINKTIDDVNPVNGKAIFTYKVEGQGKTYYAVIVVDSETKTGTTTLKGLKIGNYTVTELNTMRFAQKSVNPNGGAASVTRNGEAKVDFTNELKVRTNFSHTDVTVNHFTKTADGISISEENDDNPTVETTRTAIVAPVYR